MFVDADLVDLERWEVWVGERLTCPRSLYLSHSLSSPRPLHSWKACSTEHDLHNLLSFPFHQIAKCESSYKYSAVNIIRNLLLSACRQRMKQLHPLFAPDKLSKFLKYITCSRACVTQAWLQLGQGIGVGAESESDVWDSQRAVSWRVVVNWWPHNNPSKYISHVSAPSDCAQTLSFCTHSCQCEEL